MGGTYIQHRVANGYFVSKMSSSLWKQRSSGRAALSTGTSKIKDRACSWNCLSFFFILLKIVVFALPFVMINTQPVIKAPDEILASYSDMGSLASWGWRWERCACSAGEMRAVVGGARGDGDSCVGEQHGDPVLRQGVEEGECFGIGGSNDSAVKTSRVVLKVYIKLEANVRMRLVYSSQILLVWKVEKMLEKLFLKLGSTQATLDIHLRWKQTEEMITCYSLLDLRHMLHEVVLARWWLL